MLLYIEPLKAFQKIFFAYYESDWWQEISATSPTVKPDIILNASKLD